MRIARCQTEHGPSFAILEGDEALPLPGAPWDGQQQPAPVRLPLNRTRLLAPCTPSKIIAVGLNSQIMTLLPGDVIATGTPAGVGPLMPGDVVAVTIAGIGTLTNTVAICHRLLNRTLTAARRL